MRHTAVASWLVAGSSTRCRWRRRCVSGCSAAIFMRPRNSLDRFYRNCTFPLTCQARDIIIGPLAQLCPPSGHSQLDGLAMYLILDHRQALPMLIVRSLLACPFGSRSARGLCARLQLELGSDLLARSRVTHMFARPESARTCPALPRCPICAAHTEWALNLFRFDEKERKSHRKQKRPPIRTRTRGGRFELQSLEVPSLSAVLPVSDIPGRSDGGC